MKPGDDLVLLLLQAGRSLVNGRFDFCCGLLLRLHFGGQLVDAPP